MPAVYPTRYDRRMKLGDEGDDVRRLQLALMARGYSLPRFGADADFGRETAAAVRLFAADSGVPWSSSQPVPDLLLEQLDLEDDDTPVIQLCDGELDLEGVRVYDLRDEQADPHPKGKTRGG